MLVEDAVLFRVRRQGGGEREAITARERWESGTADYQEEASTCAENGNGNTDRQKREKMNDCTQNRSDWRTKCPMPYRCAYGCLESIQTPVAAAQFVGSNNIAVAN